MQSDNNLHITRANTAESDSASNVLETNFGNEVAVEYVPYRRLITSPQNVRTTPPTGIPGLADNIAAKGLLQNLVVHVVKKMRGKYPKLGVCAGQRRLAALDLLAGDGRITGNYLVPVKIVSEAEALAASLIENQQREPMDPVDQCLSFKRLLKEGKRIEYIAALFSVSPLTVKRRLKLAEISPKLLAVFREQNMTRDQLTALALSDDHDTQERLWFNAANAWQRTPNCLRQAITHAEIDASRNRMVRFVGLDQYEAAGGYVRRDLFSDEQNAGFITDAELLQKLVAEKLEAATNDIYAEGWGWVETRTERDYAELNCFGRLEPGSRVYTRQEQRGLKALTKQRDALAAKLDACDENDENADENSERLELWLTEVNTAIDAFAKRTETWEPGHAKRAGAFVMVSPAGDLLIERGLVKREDKAALVDVGASITALPDEIDPPDTEHGLDVMGLKEKPLHSEKLCRRLTAHRTAAVQAELAKQPSMALAVLLHRLIPQVFSAEYRDNVGLQCVELRGECAHEKLLREADDLVTSAAWSKLDAQRQQWASILPKRVNDLLPWLIDQDPGTTLLELLAFCTASMIDGVSGNEVKHPINTIAKLLDLDMSRYWTPTRAQYFDHVTKARIIDVVANAVSPKAAADLQSMKKCDAAAAAELRLAKTRWLPGILTFQAGSIAGNADPEYDEGEDADDNSMHADAPETVANGDVPMSTTLPAWPFPKGKTVTALRSAM